MKFAGGERVMARVIGRVVSRPRTYRLAYEPFEPWLFDNGRTAFLVDAETIETIQGPVRVSGRVRVTVKEAALAVHDGARVEVFGTLYRPGAPRNPGQFDWGLYSARHGVWVRMSCKHAESGRVIERATERSDWNLVRIRDRVRRALLDDRIDVGDEHASLLDAMVLGRRTGIDRRIEQSFVDTGCAHYLAVSGFHVGMLAMAMWFISRVVGLDRRPTAMVVAAVVIAYAVLGDPRPSVIRAAIMACAFCGSLALGRRSSAINALLLACLIIIVWNPASLFDIGFQLSFTAVAGILYLYPPIRACVCGAAGRAWSRWAGVSPVSADVESRVRDTDRLPHPGRLSRLGRWFGRGTLSLACVSATAWLCTLPIVAIQFGRVTPWGWLNSLIAFPCVLAVMVTGFAKLAAGVVFPVVSGVVDLPLDLATGALVGLMSLLEQVPGTIMHVPPPPWWVCALYYVALGSLAAWGRSVLSPRHAAVAVAALMLSTAFWLGGGSSVEGVRVTVLSVGRGQSAVVELPGGRTWLVDAGASGAYDAGKSVILPYLKNRGIRRVEGIILSHPNLDHFGGLPSVLDALDCGTVYVSPYFRPLSHGGKPSAAMLEALDRRKHPIEVVDSQTEFEFADGVTMQFLWPTPETAPGLAENATSLVMRLSYAGRTVLFTGDVGEAPMQWLIQNEDLSADVLLLPHHGSMSGNAAAFMDATGADDLIQSSFVHGADNAALVRIVGNRRLFNTAEVGAVEITIDADHLRVRGFVER